MQADEIVINIKDDALANWHIQNRYYLRSLRKNTSVQNNHIWIHTMTSKKMVRSYYCLNMNIWIKELHKHLEDYFSLDTKFTTKQQRVAEIGTILWFWKSSPI